MEKTKRKNWLITGLLAIAFVFMAGFAFLGIPVNANTAYAAISDYDTDKTKSESLIYTSISESPTSGTKDNWSWSGGSEKTVSDLRFFSLPAGASITITNNDSTTVNYLVYAGLRAYGSEQATIELSITHGSKNSSTTNYIARASNDSTASETYQAELLDTSSSVVTYVIKNNNANTINIFTNINYYYGKPVTLNFSKDGGSGGSDNAYVNYYFPYSSINIPTKSGYKFLGYYGADGTTQYYNANGAPTLSKFDASTSSTSLNLTAHWEIAENTVTLNKNSGTGGTNSVVATYGQAMPSATMPTRTGYTFTGYYDATSGGTKYYNANGTSAQNWDKMADTILYAQWTAKTYNLTFNNGEGQGGASGVTATYGAVLSNVAVPTLAGYTFAGYYDQANGAGNKYIDNAGHGCKAWDKDSAPTLYAYYTQNMVVAFDGYNAEYDRDFHTITVTPTNPTDAVVKYGTTQGTYNLTSAPTYKNVGEYTVYFEVTKAGWTTYYGSETVVITKTNAEYESLPAAVEGLIYNDEDLALITAGEFRYNDSGDIVYKISYTNPDTEEQFATEYSTAIPQGRFATTYTVYYKALGNNNYNGIAEASLTVTIAQVDKEELLALIAKVDAYHGKIEADYADIDSNMMAERAASQENFIDKANVTSVQISAQIEALQTALSTAKVEVVTQKIEEIGEVERTKESKALIDDAREYFEDLSEEEKAEITNFDTLTTSEEKYDKLVFDFKVTVSCSVIFGFLGLCLIAFAILYLLFFKKNKWIIENNKVVRAYVCKKIVPEGRKLVTVYLKKTTRPENRIYDTKEEALKALELGAQKPRRKRGRRIIFK